MFKKNNSLINFFLVIAIVCLIVSLVLTLNKRKVDNHITDIDYKTYQEIIKQDEYNIILLTSPTCYHCKNYKETVNNVADDYNLVIYDLSISKLTLEEYMEIHDKYEATKDEVDNDGNPSILTPTTIITNSGEEIDSISGDIGYNGLLNLLKDYNIIK